MRALAHVFQFGLGQAPPLAGTHAAMLAAALALTLILKRAQAVFCPSSANSSMLASAVLRAECTLKTLAMPVTSNSRVT